MPQGMTSVGNYFAYFMFTGCNGDKFTMNGIFTMPQNLQSVGTYFGSYMFGQTGSNATLVHGCNGKEFTMGGKFNMPQSEQLTSVGAYFGYKMFYKCNGNAFTMNGIFTMPQSLTEPGNNFGDQMFSECHGDAFTMGENFNLPPNINVKTTANNFCTSMFYNCYGEGFYVRDDDRDGRDGFKFVDITKTFSTAYLSTFQVSGVATTPGFHQQKRSVKEIVADVTKTTVKRYTFADTRNTNQWTDYNDPSLGAAWKP
jgi:hypothetical protein